MASNKVSVVLQPLDSCDFVSTLRSFCRMLLSCVGPEGGIKIVISGAGYTTFTSSSSRLLNNITLSNPICVFIKQIIQSQINAFFDHGLYTGILITSLLEKILSHNIGLSVPAAASVIEHLSSILLSLFDLSCIKLKADFSTVEQLLALVKSVLSSKPTCGLTRVDIQNLQLSIVKGFLQTTNKTFGDVIVECIEASEMKSDVFPGILYQINYDDISTVLYEKCNKKGYISLLLFNIMLTGEDTSKISENRSIRLEGRKNYNSFVEEAVKLFEQLVELNIDVVACQKVVHPTLCLYLQRKGILLLDRMGTDLTHAVEKLSGATPISSIKHCSQDPDGLRSLLGTVEALRMVEHGQKYYVLLEKSGSNIATLIAHAPNEEAAVELKVVIKQSLSALHCLTIYPALVPGAGCTEMSLVIRLQDLAVNDFDNCTRSQLESCVSWLQIALLSAAGFTTASSSHLTADTVFGHAWKPDREACCCGLVSVKMVHDGYGRWIEVFNNDGNLLLQDITALSALSSFSLSVKEDTVVDLFQSKHNAMKLSLESCVNLLGIGMIVYKSPND